MLKERHKAVLRVYSRLHEHRKQWFSSNLRFAAMIVCVVLITLAYNYFEANYATAITEASGRVVTVSSLLFNSFIAGAVFGIAVFLVIAEGEYLLGIRRQVYAQLGVGKKPRAAARRKAR
jgi:multisubunit Na+/H+ antiporter MnhB subunit